MSDENVYALAGPKGSVAIESGATSALEELLKELEVLSSSSGDAGFKFVADRFTVEMNRPQPDGDAVRNCWKALQAAAILNGAFGLMERIGSLLQEMRLA